MDQGVFNENNPRGQCRKVLSTPLFNSLNNLLTYSPQVALMLNAVKRKTNNFNKK